MKEISGCANECTQFSWCIAYSTFGDTRCYLMTSFGLCPSGWKVNEGHIATSTNDLVASSEEGYNCVVKVAGMTSFYLYKTSLPIKLQLYQVG